MSPGASLSTRRRLVLLPRPRQPHILPRIGHADARGLERIPDAQEHLALDIAQPRLGVDDPVAQFVLDRALDEGGDPPRGLGMTPAARIRLRADEPAATRPPDL